MAGRWPLSELRALAVEARDFKWEPCAVECAWNDNPYGPCTCGAERRGTERQAVFRRELGPDTIIDLIDRIEGR